jgi:3-deoxy-D-manno-octulosonate 8-phosphate phosphatase KdsC-like HAD superfamily phosphatase
VLKAAHLVIDRPGGQGAVRVLIEKILEAQRKWSELKGRYEA